jgi:hypothetical protein
MFLARKTACSRSNLSRWRLERWEGSTAQLHANSPPSYRAKPQCFRAFSHLEDAVQSALRPHPVNHIIGWAVASCLANGLGDSRGPDSVGTRRLSSPPALLPTLAFQIESCSPTPQTAETLSASPDFRQTTTRCPPRPNNAASPAVTAPGTKPYWSSPAHALSHTDTPHNTLVTVASRCR